MHALNFNICNTYIIHFLTTMKEGGPKGVPGILSDDKQTITFPDGNKWTKNAKKFDGIYKDPKYPDGYRISE